jgi:anti-sigma-K factor RskA
MDSNQPDEPKTKPLGRGFHVHWLWWAVGAGALAVIALLLVVTWNLFASRNEVRELQSQLAVLQQQSSERDEVLELLANSEVRVVDLTGGPANPNGKGQLLWNPVVRTGILLVAGLEPTPAGQVYELWAIAGKEAVPAGVFTVDTRGAELHRLPKLPDKNFSRFTVTIEPAGGSPKPTRPTVLAGNP